MTGLSTSPESELIAIPITRPVSRPFLALAKHGRRRPLSFGGYATPATYAIRGRQYVVIASGGGQNDDESGDAYVAFL